MSNFSFHAVLLKYLQASALSVNPKCVQCLQCVWVCACLLTLNVHSWLIFHSSVYLSESPYFCIGVFYHDLVLSHTAFFVLCWSDMSTCEKHLNWHWPDFICLCLCVSRWQDGRGNYRVDEASYSSVTCADGQGVSGLRPLAELFDHRGPSQAPSPAQFLDRADPLLLSARFQ